ncbi:hypothetical protein A2U01_0104347, partial [Trifolium medium]|nr:hypothetical protein [Trifolium medium]
FRGPKQHESRRTTIADATMATTSSRVGINAMLMRDFIMIVEKLLQAGA